MFDQESNQMSEAVIVDKKPVVLELCKQSKNGAFCDGTHRTL
ncbi:MAG: hypothetical protein RLZZ511_2907 [Cyanobacteriota bacterium]|jgi:CDGSH-type Zn-finger protein